MSGQRADKVLVVLEERRVGGDDESNEMGSKGGGDAAK